MRLNEINSTKRKLITEGWNDPRLTLLETQHLVPFIKSFENYIVEANLNPKQISQLFTDVEAGATASGGNRTALGKGADAVGFVNTKMKELGQAVKKTGPVANADAKFKELKAKIGAKDGKVVQAIQGVSDWAKENPGKATIAVSILTVAAGMAGGPLGGAIGGFLMRATKDLLQGKDLSSAVGSSLKTAAVGALVGVISNNVDFGAQDVEGGINTVGLETDGSDVVDAVGDAADGAPVEDILASLTQAEYTQEMAEKLYNAQIERFGGKVSESMITKIADSIEVSGSYPDNFSAKIDGSFIRGSIFLNAEEASELAKQGFQGTEIMGDEASEWLKNNVEGYGNNATADIAASSDLTQGVEAVIDEFAPGVELTADEMNAILDSPTQEGIPQEVLDQYNSQLDAHVKSLPDGAAASADGADAASAEVEPETTAGDGGDQTSAEVEPEATAGEKVEPLDSPSRGDVQTAETPEQLIQDGDKIDRRLSKGSVKTYIDAENSGAGGAQAKYTITTDADGNYVKTYTRPLGGGGSVTAGESTQFNPIQIETIIEWCDQSPAVMLTEGPLDAIKKGAAAAGGAIKKGAAAVGAKAAKVGKGLTTKVTADKLNKAWTAAGKPTDSDKIAGVLRQQGVDDKVLAPVYKQLGAKLPPAPVAADPKAPAAPGAKPGPGGKPAAAGQAAAPGAKPGPGGKPAAPGAAPAAPGAAPAAPGMDFKAVQQAVAKLSPQDANALVQHIDSLAAAPQTAPAAGGNAASDATAPAEKNPAKSAAAGDTFEKAKGDIRKVQGGQKPMPPKTAATIASDLTKLSKGDKESGVAAAQKIMTFAKAGVDVSKQQQAWVANAKAGERFLTQSVYFEISKMLRENNLRWSDLGIRIHLLEGTNKMFGISYI